VSGPNQELLMPAATEKLMLPVRSSAVSLLPMTTAMGPLTLSVQCGNGLQ
jgi:hypothetical protein